MITNEELLRPRFKVIADYPGCEFEIGYIINLVEIYPYSGQSYSLRGGRIVAPSYFERFPAIFQPLQWWEERAVEDLPMFLKWADEVWHKGAIVVVDAYVNGGRNVRLRDHANVYEGYLTSAFHPATQEEYESFKAEKK